MNITLVGVGGANSASVNWSVSLSSMDGTLIDSDSGNALIDDGVNYYVETMLGDAPLGLSNLSIVLSGDIGAPGQDQWTTYHTIIQRLRPLDISIGNPIFNPVDSQGLDSGNLTINDGDFVRIDVPVINDGDVPWNGTLELSVDSDFIDDYVLEVSTPGLDRKFFYSYQLNDFVGKTLKIKLKDKINDKKTFKAILKSVENDSLELNIGKEELTIDFGIIDMCKLMPNYKEILREKNGR